MTNREKVDHIYDLIKVKLAVTGGHVEISDIRKILSESAGQFDRIEGVSPTDSAFAADLHAIEVHRDAFKAEFSVKLDGFPVKGVYEVDVEVDTNELVDVTLRLQAHRLG